MALKRTEVWPNSRLPADQYRQVASLVDEAQNHVTSRFLDAEAVQERLTAHLLLNPLQSHHQKMSKLSSVNAAERTLILRLKMELMRAQRRSNETGPAAEYLEIAEARFVAASGRSADVERLAPLRE